MEENVIQINCGIATNPMWLEKTCAKKITFGILLHVVTKMENI